MRSISIAAVFIVSLAGCTITPSSHVHHRDDHRHSQPTVVHETYSYTRIIYVNRVPYYVDEDRHAHPIPPHLRGRYKYSPNASRTPPAFSNDTGRRDGYHLARIIYINDVPHHVENDRSARPLPRQLHNRFRYSPAPQADGHRDKQAPGRHQNNHYGNNGANPAASGYGREIHNGRADPKHQDDHHGFAKGGRDKTPPSTPAYRLSKEPEQIKPARSSGNDVIRDRHVQDQPRGKGHAGNVRSEERYDENSNNGKQSVKDKGRVGNKGNDDKENDKAESARNKRNGKE